MIARSYRYIVKAPGVRSGPSGHAIVEGTRVGVYDVVALTQTGASVEQVVSSLPWLTRAQVYEDHRSEIDPLVAQQLVI